MTNRPKKGKSRPVKLSSGLAVAAPVSNVVSILAAGSGVSRARHDKGNQNDVGNDELCLEGQDRQPQPRSRHPQREILVALRRRGRVHRLVLCRCFGLSTPKLRTKHNDHAGQRKSLAVKRSLFAMKRENGPKSGAQSVFRRHIVDAEVRRDGFIGQLAFTDVEPRQQVRIGRCVLCILFVVLYRTGGVCHINLLHLFSICQA